MSLETRIDDLYKGPLADFVAARQALAKTLSGDDARRVKALAKPTVLPWTINQLYWHARPVYDRVLKAGEKLRTTQIAALRGKSADVNAATADQREAISEGVKAASRIASEAGIKPDNDAVARMLEAISLSTTLPESPGHFTKPLQPAGFEALAGIAIASGAKLTLAPPPKATGKPNKKALEKVEHERAERERQEAEELRREEARKQAALARARTAVIEARADEKKAREEWERAQDRRREAEQTLKEVERQR